MAKSTSKVAETFGTNQPNPSLSKGKFKIVGEMTKGGVDPGEPISVNTKTGRPYKGSKK